MCRISMIVLFLFWKKMTFFPSSNVPFLSSHDMKYSDADVKPTHINTRESVKQELIFYISLKQTMNRIS